MILGKMQIPLVGGLKTDLVSCWDFDDYYAPVQDSHASYDLTEGGYPQYRITGKLGYGVEFDFDWTGWLYSYSSIFKPLQSAFSISMWAKLTGAGDMDGYFIYRAGTSIGFKAYWAYSTEDMRVCFFRVYSASYFCQASCIVYVSGFQNWTHFVFTFNGTENSPSTAKIYVNGTFMDSDSANFYGYSISNSDSMYISEKNGINPSWHVDQTAFWMRCLSATEVSALYNSGNGLAYSSWT